MAADDSTPFAPEGQSNSKRPALDRRASDRSEPALDASSANASIANATATATTTATANAASSSAAPPRAKHSKPRRVGMHGRVPSSNKALHKQHANASKANLARRQASPVDPESPTAAPQQRPAAPHRRATSDLRLARNASAGNVAGKPPAQSNLKRNRSHVEVGKRSKSTEKLKHSLSGTGISQLNKSSKSQVHFDLGSDDHDDHDDVDDDVDEVDDDEWVDASGSNSPFLSRKGSINSSTHSSAKPGGSAASSRPHSPPAIGGMECQIRGGAPPLPPTSQQQQHRPSVEPFHPDATVASSASASASEEERRLVLHKELLTSKLLQRSSSSAQVVPPKMTADVAQAGGPSRASPASTEHDPTPPPTRSREDGLTSRFVEGPSSGAPSEGLFFNNNNNNNNNNDGGAAHRADDPPPPAPVPRRSHSVTHFRRPQGHPQAGTPAAAQNDNSALVPRAAKRPSAPAEASRTQQKLNLQRASSTLEPGQAVVGGVVSVIGANPLIGVGDAGHDAGHSRDPRVGKLLERHGMEYLVVRRYQNPVARSLARLARLPGLDKAQRILPPPPPPPSLSSRASRRSVELPARAAHARNTSVPEAAGGAQSMRRTASVRAAIGSSGASFEADGERLSGSSLVPRDEEDGMEVLLRNLWEKPLDLCASTD